MYGKAHHLLFTVSVRLILRLEQLFGAQWVVHQNVMATSISMATTLKPLPNASTSVSKY